MMYTRTKSALMAVAGAAALILFTTGNALAQETGVAPVPDRTLHGGNGDAATTSLFASNSGAFAPESTGGGVAAGPEPRQPNTALTAQAPPATNATPEPWTYGLMLMGLAAIGWLKRHRQSP